MKNKEHKNIKAIRILEFIASKMGKEKMFDGEIWYELEDGIMTIIKGKQQKGEMCELCEGCGKPITYGQNRPKGINRHAECS